MHPLDVGGYVIDTPGIRGFGLVNMESAEISHYFPEIFAMKDDCKFSNCLHAEEPSCAVRSAAEEGKLAPTRYRSYLSMLSGDELDEVYRQDNHGSDSGS
jgi:ribosome biogenesis GTPase